MTAAPGKSCGTCTMCCKTMGVPDLPEGKKPPHVWCSHCDIGKGCKIYDSRPTTCREFECVWLQAPHSILDDSFRPDRVRVVFQPTDSGQGLVAHCDPDRPTAWRHPKVLDILRQVARNGEHATARSGDRYWVITSQTDWAVPDQYIIRKASGDVDVCIPHDVARRIGVRT